MKARKSSIKSGVNGEFQKRVSPRLNNNIEVNNVRNSMEGCHKRRFSPRLRKICGSEVDSSRKPSVNGTEESGVNGEFQKRVSPRLHSNFEVYNVRDSVNGCSPKRRFSPRLRNNCGSKVVNSSPKPSVKEELSPEFREPPESSTPLASPKFLMDSKPQTPKSGDSNFQRRISPRLHANHESKEHKDVCENSSVLIGIDTKLLVNSMSQIQRRFSPRFHQNPESKAQEITPINSGIQRRLSPRLHNEAEKVRQKSESNSHAGEKRSHNDYHVNNGSTPKRMKHDHSKDDGCKMDFKDSYSNGTTSNGEPPSKSTMGLKAVEKKANKDGDPPDLAGRSLRARVKETLRIFNTYYLQCVQEEEERRKKSEIEAAKKDKASNSKKKLVNRTSSRPDLKAVSKMRQKKEILYPDKRIGHVPGIDVGYQFYSRAEMNAVGFHSHWLNGIDYIGDSHSKREEHRHYTFPIAIAVVMSGQYEDDLDNSEDVIYTGQGGHDLVGSKLQCEDQVLLRGNLAMKNSMDQSVPIRVIRGHKSANSYSGKIYSYDGLYQVVSTWADKGLRGHLVYKYRLKRLEGQPKLTTNQVQFVRGCPSKTLSELPGMVCRDISNGQEDICIPVTNLFDNPPVGPEGFIYSTEIQVAESVNLPPVVAGCSCKGNCTNPKTCACAKLNGSDFPYVRRDGGRLVEAKDIVFECGPNCGCGPGCLNRTSQRGIKYRLEVYRTPDKGWAVRSWDFIPSGAPVCEYIGVLKRSDDLDNIPGNEYIFEIDAWHTINEIEGRERRFGNVPVSASNVLPKVDEKTLDSTPEFCIDAGSIGNVARFINHSCEPNLFVQCILSSHHDLRLARIVLFAADNIPAMQELTYDYGYALDSVIGPDGKIKVLPCFCGTADCRKRLY